MMLELTFLSKKMNLWLFSLCCKYKIVISGIAYKVLIFLIFKKF